MPDCCNLFPESVIGHPQCFLTLKYFIYIWLLDFERILLISTDSGWLGGRTWLRSSAAIVRSFKIDANIEIPLTQGSIPDHTSTPWLVGAIRTGLHFVPESTNP